MPAAERKAAIDEITQQLEQGIKDLFASGKYREYLSVMSRFHNYSFNNTLLIMMQKPDASHVAGYQSWQNNFGRHVKKGEKGIAILAPAPYKITVEQEKKDTDGKAVIGKNGKPVMEKTEIKIPAYKKVTVFDVSQTEGRELPSIKVNELSGSVENFNLYMEAVRQISPVPVEYGNISSGAKGYFSSAEQKIVIQDKMSQMQTAKTAVHELAHSVLHDTKLDPDAGKKDRQTKEVEAESIAYAVCRYYGLDTSEYSFGYIAAWSSTKELPELKNSLQTIRDTTAEIINGIDRQILEIQKPQEISSHSRQERTITKETSIVKDSVLGRLAANRAVIEQNNKQKNESQQGRQERRCR